MPQLFRYERQQKGRLREHFQLNVDIFGEADVAADAELLAVAIEIMRALGLDVGRRACARVRPAAAAARCSARVGVDRDADAGGVRGDRQDRARAARRLAREARGRRRRRDAAIGGVDRDLSATSTLDELARAVPDDRRRCASIVARFDEYFELRSTRSASREWVELDLTIVRGLAYYTGIVFELFDAKGEFRAICGGGRYDKLLAALGGVDLPALGFGMGDVVLGELLRDAGSDARDGAQRPTSGSPPTTSRCMRDVRARCRTALRRAWRVSVEYALKRAAARREAAEGREVAAGADVLTLTRSLERRSRWSSRATANASTSTTLDRAGTGRASVSTSDADLHATHL